MKKGLSNKKLKHKIKIKDLPEEERPRERLIRLGPTSLSNAELIAIIMRTGNKNENVLYLANRLLTNYDLKTLSQVTVGELKKIFGIKDAKACQIVAAFELGRRPLDYIEPKQSVRNPRDIVNLLMLRLQNLKKEFLMGVYLDSKSRIIKYETISVGGLNTNTVHPREVFRTAISEAAAAVILVHNHPSGDPTPSKEDIKLTTKLMEAGDIMGIKILDHIIIGGSKYFSLKERNLI